MKVGCFHFFIGKKEKYIEITDLKQLSKTKIGDVCRYGNIKFVVKGENEIKNGSCCGYCVLFSPSDCFYTTFPCRPSDREDEKGVYFAEIEGGNEKF